MDAETPRTVQAPLNERYRAAPASARTRIAASAESREPGITSTVERWAGPVRAGRQQVPVGVHDVVVTAEVDCDCDDAALEKLARSTEHYRVVGQSLRDPVRFHIRRSEKHNTARTTGRSSSRYLKVVVDEVLMG